MSRSVIEVQGVGKRYDLGETHRGLLIERLGGAFRRVAGRGRSVEHGRDETFWALRDVSLSVGEGELVGLIGANGAGKSTLLKMLANITYPTEGRIRMRGRVGTLLEVGTGFHPELTGRENVFLSGTILGMKRAEIHARYAEIVEFSGVEKFIETPVKRYSSGMYVRLGFAVAAHLSPEILLVDEVLAVGDAEFQKKCLAKMRDVVNSGRTIVFVSHNLDSVQRLCQRTYWIDRGAIASVGPSDQVVAHYVASAGAARSGGVAVIESAAPREGSGDIRFERLELRGSDGNATDRLRIGEPLELVLAFTSSRDIEDAMVEVGISSADGTRVVTTLNTDGGRRPERIASGSGAFRVRLAVTLLPGDFTVDLGAHDRPSGATFDYLERILAFRVVNEGQVVGDVWPAQVIRGSVRSPAAWNLE